MNSLLLNHAPLIRLGFFFSILVLMATWEFLAPRRQVQTSKLTRWFNNLGVVSIDTLSLRLLLPFYAIDAAVLAERGGWGLLNNISMAYWVKVTIGVFFLDLVIYLQHVMFHALPIFWRLHMMHHSDLDFDVTTGVRFHPLKILLSMGIKMMVVYWAGISAAGVLIFEVLLNGTSMFNHGNVRLPGVRTASCVFLWLLQRCTGYTTP